MNPRICDELTAWLERLPRQEPSPAFQAHLRACPSCRKHWEQAAPGAARLSASPALAPLSEPTLRRFSEAAHRAALQLETRRLARRLIAIAAACLPLVVLINYCWGALGYNLLALYLSPGAARIYLALFVVAASGMASLCYGSIPLLAGWLHGRRIAYLMTPGMKE